MMPRQFIVMIDLSQIIAIALKNRKNHPMISKAKIIAKIDMITLLLIRKSFERIIPIGNKMMNGKLVQITTVIQLSKVTFFRNKKEMI